MKNSNIRGNASVTVIIVMGIALVLAMIIGVQLGSGDYGAASTWLVVGLVLAYITHFHHKTWQIVLLAVFLGFSYYPLGFEITATHIGLMLGAALAVLYLLAPVTYHPDECLAQSGAKGMKFCIALWVLYGIAHLGWNHMDPYLPNQYAFKNALKTYVEAFGGPALILWFMVKPSGFRVGRNWEKIIVTLLFVGISVNLAIRLYYVAIGFGVEDSLADEMGMRSAASPLVIPVINLIPGAYTLRSFSPLAMAFGLIFITSPRWFSRQSRLTKFMVIGVILMSLTGAALSAGRAVILMTGFFAFVIALLRRKLILIMVLGMIGLFFVAFVNLFSSEINENAPYYMQRSLQYFMFEKGDAARSIESSTLWREELAERTYEEWRSDPRILFFGRATYSFTEADAIVAEQLGGYEAGIQSSLRRGSAHRLVADCLIQYGIVGLVLYYLMLLSMLRFLIKLDKYQKRVGSEFRNLTFILLVSIALMFPLSLVTVAWVAPHVVWLMLLLIIGSAQEIRARAAKPSAAVPPRRVVPASS